MQYILKENLRTALKLAIAEEQEYCDRVLGEGKENIYLSGLKESLEALENNDLQIKY